MRSPFFFVHSGFFLCFQTIELICLQKILSKNNMQNNFKKVQFLRGFLTILAYFFLKCTREAGLLFRQMYFAVLAFTHFSQTPGAAVLKNTDYGPGL